MKNWCLYLLAVWLLTACVHANGDSSPAGATEAQKEASLETDSLDLQVRPGDKIPDFAFISREGIRTSLYKTGTKCTTLLMVMDPYSDLGGDFVEEMMQDTDLMHKISQEEVRVVALYGPTSIAAWQRNKTRLPMDWMLALENDDMDLNSQIGLQNPPIILLLDKNKQLKMASRSWEEISNAI